MENIEAIIKNLKTKGYKVTKARVALVDTFLNTSVPVSVPEILIKLKERKIIMNKSTIYRELAFLLTQNLICQVDLRERGRKYEYNSKSHHHHLICIRCKKVEDFELEQELDIQEQKILQQKGFTVLNHSLEFFGLCSKCK